MLLIASAVASVAAPMLVMSNVPLTTVVYWAGTIAFSAALVVFAFGLGRPGSVVARQPLATGAAVLLAAWPFVGRALTAVLPYEQGTAEFYTAWGYASAAVEIAAAILVVVQIARAGIVTGRVRWAPLWALAAVVVPQVLAQLLVVALRIDLSATEDDGVFLLIGLGQLATLAAPIVLGILALLVAGRRVTADLPPVQVFPPAG
ncbi:hypothetical protein GCM10009739_12400 [Microbacterium ulmi]